MEFVSELIKLGILTGIIYSIIKYTSFFKIAGFETKWMISLFVLKVIVAYIGVYYFSVVKGYGKTSDIYAFYNDAFYAGGKLDFVQTVKALFLPDRLIDENTSKTLKELIYWGRKYQFELLNDNRTMIRVSLLFYLVGFKSYMFHVILFSFIGFVGTIAFCKVASLLFENKQRFIFCTLCLSPSILFFTSGIYKETFLFCFFGLFTYSFIKSKFRLIMILLGLLILFPIKLYFFIILLPSLGAFLINRMDKMKYVSVSYIFIFSCIILLMYHFHDANKLNHAGAYGDKFDPIESVLIKRTHFYDDASVQKGTSVYHLPDMFSKSNSFETVCYSLPFSLAATFIYPSVFQPIKWDFAFFAIENTLILVVLFWVLIHFRSVSKINNFTLFLIVAVVTYASFIGLISPIVGNLLRYKTPIMPFVWILLFRLLPSLNFKKTY
jgi:hypothetical protein